MYGRTAMQGKYVISKIIKEYSEVFPCQDHFSIFLPHRFKALASQVRNNTGTGFRGFFKVLTHEFLVGVGARLAPACSRFP